MDQTFDPKKLISITPTRRKSEPFDMRYTKGHKFRFSTDVWIEFNLDSNGVSMFKYPGSEGVGVVITVQDEEKSQALKMRTGYESKGKEFTNSELARLLGLADDQVDFTLTLMSQGEETSYLLVSSFTVKNFEINTIVADNSIPNTDTVSKKKSVKLDSVSELTKETPEEVDESVELDSNAFDVIDEVPEFEAEVEIDEEKVEESPLSFMTE